MVLFFYRLCYPLICLLAAPFWLLKMIRRGGWGSGLPERIGIYRRPASEEKKGGVYIHAVSVGETLLALKLITRWKQERPQDHFILVPTTATGMAVAREKAPDGLRVIYAPLDFGWLIRRVMKRFQPRVVVLMESELWAGLLVGCERLGISVGVANARLSPRSEKRLTKVKGIMAPFLETLDFVGVPEEGDLARWAALGVKKEALTLTGNLKFDPDGAVIPQQRAEFCEMLSAFQNDRPVVMAISTFAGEEEMLAQEIRSSGAFPVIVPRHAERREEVKLAIEGVTSCPVVLRSQFQEPSANAIFVIDSTGELRDWTAHADLVIIGKSFLAKGGQNPAEAIQAGIPVIAGPHMANFEPLVSELKASGGITVVDEGSHVSQAIQDLLGDDSARDAQAKAALEALNKHRGAVSATIAMFDRPAS